MKCPVCKESNLVMTERQSIEIDYCPECRGVWLDRGELDKIIERSTKDAPTASGSSRPESKGYEQKREYRDDDRHGEYKKHYKKKSLLGEIFDF